MQLSIYRHETTHNMPRSYSALDQVIISIDQHVFGPSKSTSRPYPAEEINEGMLSRKAARQSSRLMRVNHAGEISAQALYLAQAIAARDDQIKQSLQQAAEEEIEHLFWCRRRLEELNAHVSLLDPVWFCGAFLIGLGAGAMGDQWNLGFIAETEHQVVKHLQTHLNRLPASDQRSRAILQQMQIDEAEHASRAICAGARELPVFVKHTMRYYARIMTALAHYI